MCAQSQVSSEEHTQFAEYVESTAQYYKEVFPSVSLYLNEATKVDDSSPERRQAIRSAIGAFKRSADTLLSVLPSARPDPMTITQAQAITGLAKQTLYNLAASGKLAHTKVNGRLYFKELDVLPFITKPAY